MKTIQYECNVCGGIYQIQSDTIFGYKIERLASCNRIEYTEKDRFNCHICYYCIETIKKTPIPENLI